MKTRTLTIRIDDKDEYKLLLLKRKLNSSRSGAMLFCLNYFMQSDPELKDLFLVTWDSDKKNRLEKLKNDRPDLLSMDDELELKNI